MLLFLSLFICYLHENFLCLIIVGHFHGPTLILNDNLSYLL